MSDDPYHDTTFASTYSQFSSLFDTLVDQHRADPRDDNSPASPSPSTIKPASKYTHAPFSDDGRSTAAPHSPQSLHRRSSLVQQWLEYQQPDAQTNHDASPPQRALDPGPSTYAYRPSNKSRAPRRKSAEREDQDILDDFILVSRDEGDIPPREGLEDENSQGRRARPSPMRPSGSRFFNPPSAFRNIHLPLSSSSRRPAPAPHNSPTPSHHRNSMFHRPHTSTGSHYRSPSTSTTGPSEMNIREDSNGPSTVRSSRNWSLKRPRILNGFLSTPNPSSAASNPQQHQISREIPPSRPSFSSTTTVSSGATSTHVSMLPPDSSNTHGGQPSRFKAPSPSLWSLPSNASHLHDLPGTEAPLASRKPKSHFPHVTTSSGRIPSMLSVHKDGKKKKLVISGVPKGDQRRLQNVKLWLESFGEVNQIIRAPNGDLHVDFRRSEVADTVCRVNARVHITGVGSVSLSWYTGKMQVP